MAQLNRTFFDYLSMAHAERVHSQVLGWLLSLEEAILPEKQKSSFLNSLFGLNEEFTNIKVETETDSIDVLITSDTHVFVIENKLKSSEHSEQTNKYSERFEKEERKVLFGFLSLIGDAPKNSRWQKINYKQLYLSLQYLSINTVHSEYYYLKDYINTVKNLFFVYETFIGNHQAYKNVFYDGNKSKSQKGKNPYIDSEIKEYIRENQLETIFQKGLLKHIMNSFDKNMPYSIGETHGNALLQINAFNFKYKNHYFDVGLQIQLDSFKVNIVSYSATIDTIDETLISIFTQVFMNKNGYVRLNKPTKNAYLSVSKQNKGIMINKTSEQLLEIINLEIDFISSLEKTLKEKIL